jgi:autotransporter passenger strand-loop-strand repeat protein
LLNDSGVETERRRKDIGARISGGATEYVAGVISGAIVFGGGALMVSSGGLARGGIIENGAVGLPRPKECAIFHTR